MRCKVSIVFLMFFLCGCASGKLSADQGRLRFAIPFDFPQPSIEQEKESREENITEEMGRIEQRRAAQTPEAQK